MLTLDFLRHGEPEGGVRYRGGGVDDPLSERGWRQMWEALGGERPWTRVVSSPLRRCYDFAAEFAGRHGLPLEVDPRLREVGFGRWEGLRHEQARDADPAFYAAFYADPVNHRPPGAEPLEAFVARVHAGIRDLFERHRDERILVVCHMGTIRGAVSYALQPPLSALYRIHMPFAGRMRLSRTERGLELWW